MFVYKSRDPFSVLKPDTPIRSGVYCKDDKMMEKLLIKQLKLVNRSHLLFLQNNIGPHTPRITGLKLQKLKLEALLHLAYLYFINFHFFMNLNSFSLVKNSKCLPRFRKLQYFKFWQGRYGTISVEMAEVYH